MLTATNQKTIDSILSKEKERKIDWDKLAQKSKELAEKNIKLNESTSYQTVYYHRGTEMIKNAVIGLVIVASVTLITTMTKSMAGSISEGQSAKQLEASNKILEFVNHLTSFIQIMMLSMSFFLIMIGALMIVSSPARQRVIKKTKEKNLYKFLNRLHIKLAVL